MPIWCRLCREPVIEGSLFCARHRAQAAFFSRTFGPEPGTEAASAPPPPTEPALAPRADEPARPPSVARCAESLLRELKRLAAAADPIPGNKRWPQVSIYYLHGQLHARTFYSVVPAQALAAGERRYDMQHPALRAAMAPDGRIVNEMLTLFASHEADLHERRVETLDLHFLSYAGLVAINLHRAGQKDVNLLTLSVEESGLTPVTVESVRSRLFHKRW